VRELKNTLVREGVVMSVLFLTNLFPNPTRMSGGIFIHRRLLQYKMKSSCVFQVFCLPSYEFSPALRLAMKYLGKTYYETCNQWNLDGIRYTYCTLKRNLFTVFLQKTFPEQNIRLEEQICHNILKQFDLHRLDLVHAHGMYEVAAGNVARLISERTGIPYVITLHGSDVNIVMRRRAATYVNTLERASKCIFVSNALLEKAKSFGYSGKNGVVIPNGYDPEIFYPSDKDTMRKKLGVYRPNLKYVGFVGNLNKIKRADKLPSIFWEIHKRVPDVMFIVVGDGPLRKKVEQDASGLNVVFTGRIPQEEVANWMNAMDIMVLPSRNEGFGAVAVEAQACGTIVVGSSNGGIPEAVGFEQCIVQEGHDFEKSFADKVVELLTSDQDAFRNQIMLRAKQFTWESIVSRELEVYKEVLRAQSDQGKV